MKMMQQTKNAHEARRKSSDAPAQRARLREAVKLSTIDRDVFSQMWREGISLRKMGKHFGVSNQYVKVVAEKFGLPKREEAIRTNDVRICKDCARYPCFRGIDNLDTNFAETCKSYRVKQGV